MFELSLDPTLLSLRLKKRISLLEVFAVLFCLAMCGIFIWLHTLGRVVLYDFENYMNTVDGDFTFYYYAYWMVPLFHLLEKFPFYIAYLIWSCINIVGVFFAARLFGGKTVLVLLTYQMMYSLYYGQISGFIAGGLALFCWSAANRKFWLAGLGLVIASTKFQSGFLFAGLLWLFVQMDWKSRWKTLFVPLVIFSISLIFYPGWPLEVLHRLQSNPANADGSISMWRWIGPWALLLFFPPILFPVPHWPRFLLFYTAIPLALPYFQQADLIELFVLPVGSLTVLAGNIGFAYLRLGPAALQWLFIIPLCLYGSVLVRYVVQPWLLRYTHQGGGLE